MSSLPAAGSQDPSVLAGVAALYARQSRLIDGGDATGWAATFTADGVFDSPSYDRPFTGTADLTTFAAAYADQAHATGVVSRHVVSNVDVVCCDGDRATTHAYLQIVVTPQGGESRLVRLTTLEDLLVRGADHAWRVARRTVRRDDAGPAAVLGTRP
jgi:3-phenylpropionate/cinnamic acid dioxygenase small subunit